MNDIVAKIILDHISNKEPKKALVISFHGSTGVGKSYVADFITRLLYFKGPKSEFVHKINPSRYYGGSSKIEGYKNELQNLIERATKVCSTSLFIFEEFDKMPVGLADVLTPYLDFDQEVNSVDFHKNIFIFLSNIGDSIINKEAYAHFKKGKKREEITGFKMETLIKSVAYKYGGFKGLDLSLIDFFIPFLPLERKHVKECVKVTLQKCGKPVYNKKLLDEIANELQYFPIGDETFSIFGCKLVDKKTSSHI